MARAATDTELEQAVACHRRGELASAAGLYRAVLERTPESFDALHLLGVLEDQQGRHETAVALIENALALQPQHAQALYNCGNALRHLGRDVEALSRYEAALALQPDYVQAHYNRGNTLRDLARAEEAVASYDRALALRPGHAEALMNRGNALRELNRHEQALASYEHALRARPGYAEALSNRGNALRDLDRLDEALESYGSALSAQPDYADALNNQGNALRELRRFEEAAASFERLVAVSPHYPYALGNWIGSRLQCCDWRDLERHTRNIADAVNRGEPVAAPFSLLMISDSEALQLQCARIHAAWSARPPTTATSPAAHRHGRIRLAYLSGNFYNHALTILTAGLFEAHDRTRFEVTAVSFGPNVRDAMRERLERAFDRFVDVSAMSDSAVAAMMREHGIDIAVDLNGLSQGGRPGVFAHRAAPVQVSYLGYLGTMGADYMDYLFADEHLIPAGREVFYTEKVVRLQDNWQVNDSKREIAEQTPSRGEAGLPAYGFVFCCFSNSYKITPAIFDIWMRLLREVEGSVLWLLEDNGAAVRNLRQACAERGVSPERLVFAPRVPLPLHLARHRLADLFLDTLPCNAGVAGSDALWAGLPVLTSTGGALIARLGASLLHSVGLPELVTHSLCEYEEAALELATRPETLASIRTRLESNRETCSLFDTDRTRRQIESAYILMWERCKKGELPACCEVRAAR